MNSFTENDPVVKAESIHARPAKFMFAQAFDAPKPTKKTADFEVEIAALRQEIATAEARGFQAGQEAGYQAAREDALVLLNARINSVLEQMGANSQTLLKSVDEQRVEVERDAIDLTLTISRTLARHVLARYPLTEIEALASQCLSAVRNAPHLVVRLAPDLVEEIEQRLKRLAFERGFAGRLVVVGAPEMVSGDCRIEWADGGMSRDQAEIESDVTQAVIRYLQSRSDGDAA